MAAKLTPDAVLSHHTALEFHGRAYSVWSHLIYTASRPVGPFTFRSKNAFKPNRCSHGRRSTSGDTRDYPESGCLSNHAVDDSDLDALRGVLVKYEEPLEPVGEDQPIK